MTGGRVVVLGLTGRNFAAGMSGGIAYVLDMAHSFAHKVNTQGIELGKVNDPKEIAELRSMIEEHRHYTGSEIADRVLRDFHRMLPMFVRVMPLDYKRVLETEAARVAEEKKRQSVIDLIPSQTASHVDLIATGYDPTLPVDTNIFNISTSQLVSRPTSPKPHEPAVVDLEDATPDETANKARVNKLDKTRGFMKYKRLEESKRPIRKRVKDWKEISVRLTTNELEHQTARCMDCGIPFCNSGCPISNLIPSWSNLVFKNQWKEAYESLSRTNPLPEVTGRVCPAPCEGACVVGLNGDPVGIKSIEVSVVSP
jgi:glutamate synthase (NADPH/NADH)